MSQSPAQHSYRACPERECARIACQAWKEAWRIAWDEAYGAGLADGRAEASQ